VGYWTLKSRQNGARSAWDFNPLVRCARLERLRCEFDYVIVDCPAICGSCELSALASLTDSVLLVVAAGKSTRQQMLYAKQAIADSGGWLQGCILNRRTYPIPNLLYRMLKGGAR
jgi:Mrp family chromosome partitioning ATPase